MLLSAKQRRKSLTEVDKQAAALEFGAFLVAFLVFLFVVAFITMSCIAAVFYFLAR